MKKKRLNMLRNFAYIAARCSEQAYYSKPKVDFLPIGSSVQQFNVATNGQSLTIYETSKCLTDEISGKTYIVAFRGTDERIDWNTNLSIVKMKVDQPEGLQDDILKIASDATPWYCRFAYPRLHKGYYTAYKTLNNFIYDYFEDKHKAGLLDGARIILTGHSMGGALSTVCAYDIYGFKTKYKVDIFVYTFGAPRVCNIYASVLLGIMYKDHAIRIVNGMDPVSLTPIINSWHCFPLINLYEKTYWDCFKGMLWLPRSSIHLAGSYIKNMQVMRVFDT